MNLVRIQGGVSLSHISIYTGAERPLCHASLLLRRFVFRMAEASAKRVTGDEPQGTMGRVQTAGEGGWGLVVMQNHLYLS